MNEICSLTKKILKNRNILMKRKYDVKKENPNWNEVKPYFMIHVIKDDSNCATPSTNI